MALACGAAGAQALGRADVEVPSLITRAGVFGAANDASGKQAIENFKHVGGLLFWSGRDGDTVTSDVFVESR